MTATAPVAAALVWAAVAAWAMLGAHAAFTDLRSGRISRRACWTAGTAVTVLLAGAATLAGNPLRWLRMLASAAPVALLLDVVWRRWPGKVGYGDVRLIAVNSVLTAWWGPPWPWWALLAGAVAAWPAAIAAAVRNGREARVRWAPWLAAGTAGVVAWNLHATGPAP